MQPSRLLLCLSPNQHLHLNQSSPSPTQLLLKLRPTQLVPGSDGQSFPTFGCYFCREGWRCSIAIHGLWSIASLKTLCFLSAADCILQSYSKKHTKTCQLLQMKKSTNLRRLMPRDSESYIQSKDIPRCSMNTFLHLNQPWSFGEWNLIQQQYKSYSMNSTNHDVYKEVTRVASHSPGPHLKTIGWFEDGLPHLVATSQHLVVMMFYSIICNMTSFVRFLFDKLVGNSL